MNANQVREKIEGEEARSARERILDSATLEFAEKGFSGASTNKIAAIARINKQVIYHYFGSKDGLYSAVLERALVHSRSRDDDLRIDLDDPLGALRTFLEHVTRSSSAGARLQRLLLDANWHGGRHLEGIGDLSSDLSQRYRLLEKILEQGTRLGIFRKGIDARELYISILGLFSVRVTNAHTLSRTLGADLLSEEGLAQSRRHAIELVLNSVRA